MIQVEHLVKKYGNTTAVDDLTFTIEKGKVYGFLGPNGAGKSTTMNMITGYLGATGGTVRIDGIDIMKEPQKAKKRIGYLPEIPPLYMDMTVEEYMRFASELKGIPRAERTGETAKVLELVKLSDVSKRLIKNLSKGYRQRVGLAQAVLGFPELIILDEPMVGLDPKQIIEIRDLIKQLAAEHTIILSSHILSEVSAICDQILIISKGRLVAQDTPEHLSLISAKSQTIHMTVKGDVSRIEQFLNSAPFISGFTGKDGGLQGEGEDQCCAYEVIGKDQSDIREDLFYLFAEARLPILEFNSSMASLEDVFLELTSDGTGEEAWDVSPRDGTEIENVMGEAPYTEEVSGEKEKEEIEEEKKEEA